MKMFNRLRTRHEAGTELEVSSRYNGWSAIASMVAMSNLGALTMLMTPAFIAGYLSSGRLSNTQASTLTSVELAGMTVAVILTSLVIARVDRRACLAVGLLIAALGHLASILVVSYPVLVIVRTLAGVGVGIAYTVAVAALSATRLPDRNFGIAITSNQLSVTLLLALLSWLGLDQGYRVVIGVVLAFTLLMGLGIGWFPRVAPLRAADDPDMGTQAASSTLPGVLGLVGMFLFLVAVGEVWPIVGPIAQSHGIRAAAVGSALAIAGLAGIGAGLLVSLIGSRFGRLVPLIVGTVGLACAMLTLLVASDGQSLVMSTSLIMFFWIFSIPYYLGSQSALDPSGRLAVLSSAMMPFGLAAGQALANSMTPGTAYSSTIMSSAVTFGLALATTLFGIHLKVAPLARRKASG
ncbi:DHA1 family inner membrane transport protein [Paraburkholderia sp. EB58]|jgi:DHA1 family inner membrane transport protein|uniref:MFS transporter n=1 Tax=Paraburkholderia sp. EB58 TaxID=3035125 RepID=UPI003D1C3822